MRRISAVFTGGLLVVLLITALPAATALAGSAGWAWAIARHPTLSSYHPAGADHGGQFAGSQVTIRRYGLGRYEVKFPGFGTIGGLAMVTALGSTPRVCNIVNWYNEGSRQVVGVRCLNFANQVADAQYAVYYIRGQGNVGPLAYSYQDTLHTTTTLSGDYNFNSAGGANTVHHLSTGRYRVSLGGLGGENGNVQVVADSLRAGVCRVDGWGTQTSAQDIYVTCRSIGGQLQDSNFNFTFVNGVGLYGMPPGDQSAGYVWANQPSSASYLPAANWNWSSDAPANRVTRSSVGVYTVHFNGIAGAGGGAIVTTYGSGNLRCQLGSVATSGTAQSVGVRCFSPNGRAADSSFTALFTR